LSHLKVAVISEQLEDPSETEPPPNEENDIHQEDSDEGGQEKASVKAAMKKHGLYEKVPDDYILVKKFRSRQYFRDAQTLCKSRVLNQIERRDCRPRLVIGQLKIT